MFNIEFNWKECSSGKHIVGIHVDWIRPEMFEKQHGLETQHRLTFYVKDTKLQKVVAIMFVLDGKVSW